MICISIYNLRHLSKRTNNNNKKNLIFCAIRKSLHIFDYVCDEISYIVFVLRFSSFSFCCGYYHLFEKKKKNGR